MTTLIPNKLRAHLGEQFIESLNEPANNIYYVLASKHTSYANGDSVIPTPTDNISEVEVNIYDEAIFGKKVQASDVNLMVPKYVWTANTIYDQYDQDDGLLFTKQFYVAVLGDPTYVYKCLDNNRGIASNTVPSSTSESACNFITTNDGYTWKLMYSVSNTTFNKFATSEYMPVYTSANVSSNTIAGAIDVIRITNTGSDYVATLTGQFQTDDIRESIPTITGNTTTYRLSTSASSNTDFYVGSALYISSGTGAGQLRKILNYNASTRVAVVNSAFTTAPASNSSYLIAPNVTVSGDGSGAVAYATVSSNSSVNNFISKVNIINRGSGYTYGSATITGNTGGLSNTASLKVIIPPVGGHGYDAPAELGAKSVGVSVTFSTGESGYVTTENDYRKIAILKDPYFKNVTLTLDTEVGTFSNTEIVYQIDRKKLIGTVSASENSTTVTGTGTDFNNALVAGDKVLITDITTNLSKIKTVDSITNATSLTLTSNASITTSFAQISYSHIIAQGIKSGNSSPYVTLSNVTPKFVTSKLVVGASSGATANVTAIEVGEKNFNNWNTLDNRTRISYSATSGNIPEDSLLYQDSISLSNAYYHSANSTYIFLTSEKGPINADPDQQLQIYNGSNTITLGSNKYTPDLVKGSGKVLYIENNTPISRSNSQSETIRLILNF
jgi:hypothetical protein